MQWNSKPQEQQFPTQHTTEAITNELPRMLTPADYQHGSDLYSDKGKPLYASSSSIQ
jgi:hypothetical protein